jgi:hypothetical protein
MGGSGLYDPNAMQSLDGGGTLLCNECIEEDRFQTILILPGKIVSSRDPGIWGDIVPFPSWDLLSSR